MSAIHRKGLARIEANLTPMIDMTFLLIVFFVLVSRIVDLESADMDLPHPRDPASEPASEENRAVLNVMPGPLGGTSGQASEIEIAAREILRMKQLLNSIISSNCSKSPEQVEKDSDRDFIMTAGQALEYGLIDKVFESRKKKPDAAG